MPSRRRFIGGCVGVGALTLAGCIDVMDDGEGSGTTDWTYDAGARFGASTVGTATVDVQALLESPLPEEFQKEIDYLEEEVESVDLEDVDSVAATGFLELSEELYGGSVVVLGEFDPEALGQELEDEEESLQRVDSAEGWDRYESEYGEGGAAIREDAVVFGFEESPDGTDLDPVDAAIAAGAGDAARFTDRKNGATLHEELSGDATFAVDLGPDWHEELGFGVDRLDDPMGTIVAATQAFGSDATVGEETTDFTYVLVADPEELDVETVRSFIEEAREAEGTDFDEVSVSRDGRAIVASSSVETELLLESHENALSGGHDRVQQTAPNVALSAEQTDDGRVRVMHAGGDGVERLEVIYDGVEGRRQEVWTGDPISAGDEYVTEAAVADGGSVRIVWVSEDGSHSSTLFAASF